MGPLSIAIADQ